MLVGAAVANPTDLESGVVGVLCSGSRGRAFRSLHADELADGGAVAGNATMTGVELSGLAWCADGDLPRRTRSSRSALAKVAASIMRRDRRRRRTSGQGVQLFVPRPVTFRWRSRCWGC